MLTLGRQGINRIILEFKGETEHHVLCIDCDSINRIILEFKANHAFRMQPMWRCINRIILEFKGEKIEAEGRWGKLSINRIILEFKGSEIENILKGE